MKNNKIKLMFVVESLGGGVRKHLIQLLDFLDKDTYDIYFIYGIETVDSVFRGELERLSKCCYIYKCESFGRAIDIKKDLVSFFFINKMIKEIKPDIVHCHSSKAGFVGRLAAKVQGVKQVYYTPHAYSFQSSEFSTSKKALFTLIECVLSRFCTTLTFNVSKGEKEAAIIHKVDKTEKLKVVYNGLPKLTHVSDKNTLRERLGIKQDTLLIGNVARLSYQKDPSFFLNIANHYCEQNSNCHFVWIGDGPLLDEMIEKVEKSNIKGKIDFLGFLPDTENLVSELDVMLTTSKFEGLPYSLIEAIRCSVPIVATDVIGNNEVVSEGTSGFLFDLQDSLDTICSKIELANKLDKQCIYSYFENNFSLDNMISEINLIYKSQGK